MQCVPQLERVQLQYHCLIEASTFNAECDYHILDSVYERKWMPAFFLLSLSESTVTLELTMINKQISTRELDKQSACSIFL